MSSKFLHYKIIEKLGEGGMGVVYRARDTRLNRKVALKFLPRHISNDQTKRDRFQVEAQAAAGLNHPNIAQVYAIEEADDKLCIALEYVEGNELKTVIEADQLTHTEKSKVAFQIADGLKTAHDRGIIHRDIKSRNIMIDSSGNVKIMDFGLAREEGSDHITKEDSTVGTTAYMSPEQLRGSEADNRSDIWSFGVVLYELFTGQLPFQGMHEAAVMYSITEEDPIPMDSGESDVPEYIRKILNRCLEKDPDDRYQNMGDVLDDLDGQTGKPDQSSGAYFSSQSRSAFLTIGILAITLLISFFFFYQKDFLGLFTNVPEKKYLAVLPIENFGNNPEMAAICTGLAETLSYRLSELEQYEDSYWVTPASEIRNENVTSASGANEVFGVNLAISSSLQTVQDSTRLILKLIDADNVVQLGAERVIVHSDNLSGLEEKGVRAMLNMLHIEVQPNMAETISQGSPEDPEAYEHYLRGRASLSEQANLEMLDDAIQHFEDALDIDPDFALAYAGLGESYWRKYVINQDVSLVEDAKSALNRAESINAKLPPVQYLMGLIENGTGDYEDAIGHFENVLDLDPKYSAAYRGMATAYSNLDESEKAISIYKRLIDQKPEYWGGYSDLGIYHLNRGNLDRAIENLKKVLDLTTKNSRAYSNLGYAYYYKGELKQARQMLEQSLALDNNPQTAGNLGGIHFSLGNYDRAAEMYEIALEDLPDRYTLWGGYAAATEWSGNKKRAMELYQTAIEKGEKLLEVNPHDPEVMADLATYHSDLENRQKAIEYIRKALNINGENFRVRYRAVSTYENLGMRSEALKWITADMIPDLEEQPEFKDLREDSEYKEIRSRLSQKPQ